MRTFFAGLLFLFLALSSARANSDERTWLLKNGESFRAELVRYDETSGKVTLKFNNTTERDYDFALFSVIDRSWLAEWLELEDSFDATLKKLGGRVEHRLTEGQYPTDLFIYYPSAAANTATLPCLILFHPGAKAARYLKRHIEAAEETGLMLVSCGTFRNESNDDEDARNTARFKEVFPQILALKQVDSSRVFLGGTSGGAMRAFQYTAKIPHRWAGVYSNVGWLGGPDYYHLPYPSGMRVAIVNGNQDRAANHHVKPDSDVLIKAGNVVGVIVFEGAHQEPPVRSQVQAFNWLLQNEDPDEAQPISR